MKIKTDFVTNSSSTAYVVYIPAEYPFTTKKIMDAYQEEKKWNSEDDFKNFMKDDVIEMFNDVIKQLKLGETLNRHEEETPSIIYSTTVEVLSKENLIIYNVEMGVGGEDAIHPVTSEDITKILNQHTMYGGKE